MVRLQNLPAIFWLDVAKTETLSIKLSNSLSFVRYVSCFMTGMAEPWDEGFDRLESLINQLGIRVGQIDADLKQVDTRVVQVGTDLEQLGTQVGTDLNQLGIRIDTVHGHVKLAAEGHSVLVAHVVDIKGGIERLEAGQIGLGLRMSAVESRLTPSRKRRK